MVSGRIALQLQTSCKFVENSVEVLMFGRTLLPPPTCSVLLEHSLENGTQLRILMPSPNNSSQTLECYSKLPF